MSAHKMHHSPELLQAMKNHGLVIETPSQLSDCFRFGWTAATDLSQALVAATLEAAAGKCDAFAAFRQKQLDDDEAKHWQDQDAILKRAWKMSISGLEAAASAIRALITHAQRTALQAAIDAAVAEARAEDAAALAESRAYALALEEELRTRTAKLERECALTQAQVDRMLVDSTQMYHKFDTLSEAAQALGAMPEGYCFCSKDRIGNDSKIHEPECRDLRTALAQIGAKP